MYSYKVFLSHGQVFLVELWQEGSKESFRKIAIERAGNRFHTYTNYTGRGRDGLNVTKTLAEALSGLLDFFVEKATRAFQARQPTLGDILAIFPGASVQYLTTNIQRR